MSDQMKAINNKALTIISLLSLIILFLWDWRIFNEYHETNNTLLIKRIWFIAVFAWLIFANTSYLKGKILSVINDLDHPERAIIYSLLIEFACYAISALFVVDMLFAQSPFPWFAAGILIPVPLLAIFLYWHQLRKNQQLATAEKVREEKIHELLDSRFAQAIEHIGSNTMPARMGAIHELLNLCEENYLRFGVPTMEMLESYIREQIDSAAEKSDVYIKDDGGAEKYLPLPSDIKLSFRSLQKLWRMSGEDNAETESHRPDLSNLNLSHYNLSELDLSAFILREVYLYRSYLGKTILTGADLSGAYLSRANLDRSCLKGAKLYSASLLDATIRKADLSGADLTNALNLSQRQLDSATGDEATSLPEGMRRPDSWIKSAGFEVTEETE